MGTLDTMRIFSSNLFILFYALTVLCLVQFQAKITARDVEDVTTSAVPEVTTEHWKVRYAPCGSEGRRTKEGKHCGFGWRWYEWTGKEEFWPSIGAGIVQIFQTIG